MLVIYLSMRSKQHNDDIFSQRE